LQTFSQTKDLSFTIDERNKEQSIFDVLKKNIPKQKPTNDLLWAYDSVKMPMDEIILWVEENIPAEYQGEELAKSLRSTKQS